MTDLAAAFFVIAVLLLYGVALTALAEQQRAFEDELAEDHDR